MTFGYYVVKAALDPRTLARERGSLARTRRRARGHHRRSDAHRRAGRGCGRAAEQTHFVRAVTDGRSIVVDSPRRQSVGNVDTD
jgi:hypothetical protein